MKVKQEPLFSHIELIMFYNASVSAALLASNTWQMRRRVDYTLKTFYWDEISHSLIIHKISSFFKIFHHNGAFSSLGLLIARPQAQTIYILYALPTHALIQHILNILYTHSVYIYICMHINTYSHRFCICIYIIQLLWLPKSAHEVKVRQRRWSRNEWRFPEEESKWSNKSDKRRNGMAGMEEGNKSRNDGTEKRRREKTRAG